MTKTEFESGYAKRSSVTVDWLRANGLEAVPCDCDEPDCKGWQMLGREARARWGRHHRAAALPETLPKLSDRLRKAWEDFDQIDQRGLLHLLPDALLELQEATQEARTISEEVNREEGNQKGN